MQGYPEENELLLLFECEPTFLDSPSDAIDFFYTEATYKFSNGNAKTLRVTTERNSMVF